MPPLEEETLSADLPRSSAQATSTLRGILTSTRPRQWVKNLLVFAAPLAAGRITEASTLGRTSLALAGFVLASGGTYLLNDVRDRAEDMAHPTKRHRPVAAGHLSPTVAAAAGIVLLATGAVLPLLAGLWETALVVGIYVIATTIYSYGLKAVPLLELVLVAAGFFLRALAGGTATDVDISQWFLIVTGFGALYVVATKRYAELRDMARTDTRSVLAVYTPDVLREIRFSAAAITLAGYVLWAFENAAGAGPGWLFELSIIPFTLALYRYALAVHDGAGEAPEEIFLSDVPILVYSMTWAVLYGSGVYVG